MPNKKDLFNYYYSNTVRERFESFEQLRRLEIIKAAVEKYASICPVVLDVGCGDGYASGKVLKDIEYVRFVGVEYSSLKLKECAVHVEGGVGGVIGDAENLPIREEVVDMAFCFETIEHIPSPLKALSELRRVLKPSGILFLTLPLSGRFQEPLVRFYHRLQARREEFNEHLHFFTYRSILSLVREAGFIVVKESFCGFRLPCIRPKSYQWSKMVDRLASRIRIGLTGKPEFWMFGHTFLLFVCTRV